MDQCPAVAPVPAPRPLRAADLLADADDDHTADLPEELLALVFVFLGSGDRKRYSLVYHRWLAVEAASRLRLALDARAQLLADSALLRLLARFPAISKLALKCDCHTESVGDPALTLISLRLGLALRRLKLRSLRTVTTLPQAPPRPRRLRLAARSPISELGRQRPGGSSSASSGGRGPPTASLAWRLAVRSPSAAAQRAREEDKVGRMTECRTFINIRGVQYQLLLKTMKLAHPGLQSLESCPRSQRHHDPMLSAPVDQGSLEPHLCTRHRCDPMLTTPVEHQDTMTATSEDKDSSSAFTESSNILLHNRRTIKHSRHRRRSDITSSIFPQISWESIELSL